MHVYYIVMCVPLSRTVGFCSAYPLTNTVVLPCAQCRFLYLCCLSSDTIIMLGWGLCYTVCAVPYARCASLPCFSAANVIPIQICKFVYLWIRRSLAYSHLSAVSSPTASLLWEVSMCVFYLLCCGVGLRSLSHGGI